MREVAGLYHWIEWNDRRSIALFGAFVVAFHVLALPMVLVLLALFDRAHAPFFDWAGYATRYVPVLTACAVVIFAIGAINHLRLIRRSLPFTRVDRRAAPRLWRIAEPLTIAAGLPDIRLGVLESASLNAFAYGFADRRATIVVTRALINDCDDEELGAVIAHELAHIRAGDMRYLVCANACLYAIRSLAQVEIDREKRSSLKDNLLLGAAVSSGLLSQDRALAARDAFGAVVLVVVVPFLIPVLLLALLGRKQTLNFAEAIRLTILSSREYLADAHAIVLTKNPAALVSALRRIEGRGTLSGVVGEHAAMLIEAQGGRGGAGGGGATHPAVPDRIAAIVAVSGPLALFTPSRRDTRERGAASFGRKRVAPANGDAPVGAPPAGLSDSLRTVIRGEGADLLGLSRAFILGFLLAVPAYLTVNSHLLTRPAALAPFHPRAAAAFAELAGFPANCPNDDCDTLTAAERAAFSEQRNALALAMQMKYPAATDG